MAWGRRQREAASEFSAFYDRQAHSILVFFTRRVTVTETALDLTAETFAAAFELRHQLRGTTAAEEEAWLYAIARTQLSRYWRRGQAERGALARLQIEVPRLAPDEIEQLEVLAGVEGMRDTTQRALERLPATQRDAVWMRVIDELDYPDIARQLAVSEQVVRARVSRGLRSLSDQLRNVA